MGSIMICTGTVFYSLLYKNSLQGFNGIKICVLSNLSNWQFTTWRYLKVGNRSVRGRPEFDYSILGRMCHTTHLFMWRDSWIHVTWLICMLETSQSYLIFVQTHTHRHIDAQTHMHSWWKQPSPKLDTRRDTCAHTYTWTHTHTHRHTDTRILVVVPAES